MLHLQTLENQSLESIRYSFNESFREYFVPLHFTPEQLSQKLQVEGYAPGLSVGAFDGEQLVGQILHAVGTWEEAPAAYNCGTGVQAAYRGQQLTRRLYDYVLPKLKERGIRRSVLEVIQENQKAMQVYQSVGFQQVRELLSFSGTVPHAAPDTEVQEAEPIHWEKVKEFWSWQPSWQHTPQCLQRAVASYSCYTITREGQVVAYAMINPLTNRLPSFAVSPQWRRQGLGLRLFRHLQYLHPQKPLTVINVAAGATETLQFMQASGLSPLVQQYEMVLDLA